MSRPLSNPEFIEFTNTVDLNELNLPPWGAVVQWNGMAVLVFEGPGGLFLTDISDILTSINIAPPWEFHVNEGWAVWHLPSETAAVIHERIVQVGQVGGFVFDHLGLLLTLGFGAVIYFESRR